MAQQATKHPVLVTGGSGYIGAHTVLELVNAGYECVVMDNLSNSTEESLKRVGVLTGRPEAVTFHQLDVLDVAGMEALFKQYTFSACIHFAGLKAVGESVAHPLMYYENNITGAVNLLKLMDKYECRKLVFSSSATVYGEPSGDACAITEDFLLRCTNPYGRTKLFIEDILRDVAVSAPGKWKLCILRYFNPFGADSSGSIGENPQGIPNNLFPYILQVAVGRREKLSVFGSDYDTPDGTGVRDYIHVTDLAKGHVAALKEAVFGTAMKADCEPFNLGSGRGVSVLEMLAAVGKAVGKTLPHELNARRPGDVATTVCNPEKANTLLKWKATKTLEEACADGWRWQSQNPNGFKSA